MFCWGFLPIKYSILIQYHENEGTEGLYLMLNVHLYGKSQAVGGRRNSRPEPSASEGNSYEAPNGFILVLLKKRINRGKV